MRTRGGHTKEPCKTTYNVDFLIHPYSTYFNGTINHAVFVQLLVGLYNKFQNYYPSTCTRANQIGPKIMRP